MKRKNKFQVGLIGTLTWDKISRFNGFSWEGPGGVLYQAAVFETLGAKVVLYAKAGRKTLAKIKESHIGWRKLDLREVEPVPGWGHRVNLYYPQKGERREVVENSAGFVELTGGVNKFKDCGLIMLVLNSGYDIKLKDWREIAGFPGGKVWLDIHSLPLSGGVNKPRRYRGISFWKQWCRGVDYLQANEKEAACMLGEPERNIKDADLRALAEDFFKLEGRAMFITRGRKGVNVLTPGENRLLEPEKVNEAVDTTGCGDVLGAAAAGPLEVYEMLKEREGEDYHG